MNIEFDEVRHEYKVDGVIVPSVTEILRVTKQSPGGKFYPAGAAERGKRIHKAIETGAILEDPIEDSHVMAFHALTAGLKIAANEIMVHSYDTEILFCGTADIIFEPEILGEVKTGNPEPWHKLQCQMYMSCLGFGLAKIIYTKPEINCIVDVEYNSILIDSILELYKFHMEEKNANR